jgi:pyruvate kinase
VIDHADAVMLSAESATGKYPVKAVEMLTKVLTTTEASVYDDIRPDELCVDKHDEKIAKQISVAFEGDGVHAIVTGTQFGDVARLINRHRPEVPIFVAATSEIERNQLSLMWGVIPFEMKKARSVDVFNKAAKEYLEENKLITKKQQLVFVTSL